MNNLTGHKKEILNDGFAIIENVFERAEIEAMISAIDMVDQSNITFRKTGDLFAIRQFLQELPQLKELIFNYKLKVIVDSLFGDDYFVVKSIYFDKPAKSNWFVGWHQDLTIAVDKKVETPGYDNWTIKLNRFAVQPPLEILQNNFTVRIHLDNTDEGNGALKVISGSHQKNICRPEHMDLRAEMACKVRAGGIMIMRPLLMHASNRITSNRRRRVIHIEFSNVRLPGSMDWVEKASIN